MFRAPGSSDPPSTPDSRRSLASNPSTTPAGPPPSYREPPSFTPIGPPPPSVLGSSQLGTGISKRSLFQTSSQRSGAPKAPLSFANAPKGRSNQPQFGAPSRFQSSPPQPIQLSDDEEDDADAMEDVKEQGNDVADTLASPEFAFEAATGLRGIKRGRNGESLLRHIPTAGLDVISLAKGIAASQRPIKLWEPDVLILETERGIEPMTKEGTGPGRDTVYDDVASDLQKIWIKYGRLTQEEVGRDGLGPISYKNVLAKANFVLSLLLRLYHPSALDSQQARQSQFGRSLRSLRPLDQQRNIHMPKVLFNWLDEYHDPAAQVLTGVLAHKGGFSAAPDFWDCVYSCLFRGRFAQVIDLLQGANFAAEGNYSDRQIDNIEEAVEQTCRLLANCPAVKDDDWDMKGPDWAIFRRKAQEGLDDLRDFAEGDIPGSDDIAFGQTDRSSQFGLSTASRRAETHVPYEVYEPLQEVYKLLLGDPDDLMKSAFDWVEAAIGLAAWWDGEDEQLPRGSLAMSRRSVNRIQHSRPVDVTPALAYRQRLAFTLAQALEDEELKETFDASDALQVSLAAVFQSNVDAALMITKGWSITMTTATAELADAAGWLPDSGAGSKDAMRGLDESDLMVLSYGNDNVKKRINKKDELLGQYADLLASKALIQAPSLGQTFEGWYIALTVLARVDNVDSIDSKANTILDRIPLDSSDRVDSVLNLCTSLSFDNYSVKIAEKYADQLSSDAKQYGTAILYYARARNTKKVKEILNVLVSLSLIQSTAYPPSEALDDRLRAFVTSPKEALAALAAVDAEAARTLSIHLSGYATLRAFYAARDALPAQAPAAAVAQRKRAAAPALLAAVASAAEPIAGGLFDAAAAPVLPVDALLLLLGEALPLVAGPGQPQGRRILATAQLLALLRAAEDLQTVSPRVVAACADLFRAAAANARGAEPPSPKALLRKRESSGLSGSEVFSVLGSGVLGSQESGQSGGTSEGSGVLVKGNVRRGWDWRAGLSQNASAEDVLRILRYAIACELGTAWSVDDEE